MRAIAVYLLLLSGLGLAAAPAVGQGASNLGTPTVPETANRPKINTKNKGGPPKALTATVAVDVNASAAAGTSVAAERGSAAADGADSLPAASSYLPLLFGIGLLSLLASFAVRLFRTSRPGR